MQQNYFKSLLEKDPEKCPLETLEDNGKPWKPLDEGGENSTIEPTPQTSGRDQCQGPLQLQFWSTKLESNQKTQTEQVNEVWNTAD